MGDDTKPENTASQAPEQEEKRLSVFQLLYYGVASWLLKRVPPPARAAAVYDTPEYQKMQGTADELYQDTIDLQEDNLALQESSDSAERRANFLEDRMAQASNDLAHAQKMKIEAEARAKEAWRAHRDLGDVVIALRQDIAEAEAALEAQATFFDEKFLQRSNELAYHIRQLSAAVSRFEAMEIVYHDSLDLVPGLVLCLDSKNGVAKASAGFKRKFGVSDSYFEVPLPEEVHAKVRHAGARQMVASKPLAEVLSNPNILERYSGYAEYFFPQLWDEPHFSMVLGMDINGRKKQFMANVKILKKPVIVRYGTRQEKRFAYAGARVELDNVPNRLVRDLKEAVLSFFRSRIAYASPEGVVTQYDIDRAVKEAVSSPVSGGREKDVLIDFANAESVEPEAVKKVVNLYEYFRGRGSSERYFIVPQRLRGQFFDAGLPPRAMLLPENYKKGEASLKAPELAPQQA